MKTVILSHIIIFMALCGTAHAQEVTQCIEPTEIGKLRPLAEWGYVLSNMLLEARVNHWVEEADSAQCNVDLMCVTLAEKYLYVVPPGRCESPSGCRLEVMDRPIPRVYGASYYPPDMMYIYLLIDYKTCTCSVLGLKPMFSPYFHAYDPEFWVGRVRASLHALLEYYRTL